MTSPNNPARPRYGSDDESIGDWLVLHRREVSWTVLVVALIVAGFWFFRRSQAIKSQRAESAYFQARQSVAAGNMPLAISDLQKVVVRYEGTSAGTQAGLSLAQAFYSEKKYKEGIAALKKVEAKAPGEFRPSIYVLEADGYEELKDFAAAAEQYSLAAKVTTFPLDKAKYQAAAARDYMAAGKTEDAKRIWSELAKDDSKPEAAEARVRLGELTAKAVAI